MKISNLFKASAAFVLLSVSAAQAATISRVVLKASDSSAATAPTVDPYLDWINAGGVNEGVAGAADTVNNGIDFKDSWVDTNWGLVDSARVSFFTGGQEVAFLEFATAGTTKSNFFDLANLTSSTWGTTGGPDPFPGQHPLPHTNGQYFSIAGSIGNDRHWYVNHNWGGCGIDRGWFVVLDGTTAPNYVCNWEDIGAGALGSNSRGFMYSTLGGYQNFNNSTIGIADTFAVSVTYTDMAPVPVPASALLLGSAIGGLALRRRRRKG